MVMWITAIMLIIAVALFVAAPLADYVLGSHSADGAPEPDGRARDRALAIQALRELEFDYAMGKLDDGDYSTLKQRLENRALAAMDTRQNAVQRLDLALPSPVAVGYCSRCQVTVAQTDTSCPNCGAEPTAAATGEIR